MGWIICTILFGASIVLRDQSMMIAAGLFAISGSIEIAVNKIDKLVDIYIKAILSVAKHKNSHDKE